MKKKILAVIAFMMTMILGIVMTGCGQTFDPCAYVKGQMELLQTGKASEELLANTDASKEELEKYYQNAINNFSDSFFKVTEGSFEDNEKNRDKLGEVFTTMMSSVKYTVSDEYTEKDGKYFVDVNVEASKIFDENALEKWANDWMTENLDDLLGETDDFSGEFWTAYCDYIIENASTAGNKEAETVTVGLEQRENSDYYIIDKNSTVKLLKAMFGF